MVLKVFTDGGSKGNPGPSSIGIVLYLDNKKVFEHKESIGIATNNDAEYIALIRALEIILLSFRPNEVSGEIFKKSLDFTRDDKKNIKKIEFNSDSRLMVNQVNGLFKVKNGKIKEYILKIRTLEMEINSPISYSYIPREKNTVADNLVNSVT